MNELSLPEMMREKILALEQIMLADKETQVDINTRHYFTPGIYAREIFIPKGVAVVGKLHKTEHLNIVSQGIIEVATDEGVKTITAPYTFVAKPGTKRAGYALEDTVWTTIHASKETDLVKLEEQLIAKTYQEYLTYVEQLKLESK